MSRMLGAGYWVLGTGYWVLGLDIGHWLLDIRHLILDLERKTPGDYKKFVLAPPLKLWRHAVATLRMTDWTLQHELHELRRITRIARIHSEPDGRTVSLDIGHCILDIVPNFAAFRQHWDQN